MRIPPRYCIRTRIRRIAFAVGLAGLVATAGTSAQVAQVPLTLTTSVKPNIMLVLDDSGSMDWEMLFPTSEGVLYWDTGTRSFFDAQGGYVNTLDSARAYTYLFPNGSGAGNKAYANSHPWSKALPPRPEFAFARSPDYNGMYYDPRLTYSPWVSVGSHSFGPANPAAALSDPGVPGSAAIDLTRELHVTNDDEWRFHTFRHMRGADGDGQPSGTVYNPGSNTFRLDAYRYYPATYYLRTDAPIVLPSWIGGRCDSAGDHARYRNFVANWTPQNQANLPAGVDAIGPDGACLRKYEIRPGESFPSGRSHAAEMQNFANWFQYHRKRHLALRASLGQVFDGFTTARVGTIRINSASGNVTMRDVDVAADRQALYSAFYGMTGGRRGTPNRQAFLHACNQFDTNPNIVQYSCQQNFTLLFTDGYTNLPPAGAINVGNVDGDAGPPYADGYANSIADIAMRYYRRIRSDLPGGRVPVQPVCSLTPVPAQVDCNRDPHMNTYAITLGAVGNLFGTTHHRVADAYAMPPAWPDPAVAGKGQVDDLYHAAVNGRGEMYDARSAEQLAIALREALRGIQEQVTSSLSAVAANATRLDTGTMVYQARFNSTHWSGELLAYGVRPDGRIGELRWDAGQRIPAPSARQIYTRTGAGLTVPFRWENLDPQQQAALDRAPAGTPDGLGAQRVDWLRGARDREQANGGPFRNRARVLGDIVNSNPVFVAAADYGYERLPAGSAGRDSYQGFRLGNRERRPMLYIGANDGMLHAFDAETGIERWAYIPSGFVHDPEQSAAAASPLVALTDPAYRHRYYMDGKPVAGDAYFDGAWRTVLVAPMGAGGRGLVAFDVTRPDSFGPDKVLWEFSDPELGHVIGRPSIARLANGDWAVVFGSGYGLARSAKLFVVRLRDGHLLARISTVRPQDEATAAANGLGAPFVVDVDGNAVADYAYAGDLYGNLWKFDLRDSNPSQWSVVHSQGGQPRPLITVCASGDVSGPFACPAASRQPITARPVVGRGPNGEGLMVYFGTGKFFEVGDNLVGANPPIQSVYGVFDANSTTGNVNADRVAGRSQLVRQQIVAEVVHAGSEYRVTSAELPTSSSKGWYLDLVSPRHGREGERVVADPVLRSGRLIFTTLIPSSDPCATGGSSWLMELGALSGGRFDYPVLDIDGDGVFGPGDEVEYGDGERAPPTGRRSEVGIVQTPAIIEGEGEIEHKVMGGSSGGIESVGERASSARGRNSWRQYWP
ncbi:MAG: pilus assembly protein [Rehaibacterium terrae]|uniref:pilus assembly protein n=1 Tax=Rehaibacterium terrae TaxID=1341696 RepID=UPI00391CCCD8